jgi:hypothetical protein
LNRWNYVEGNPTTSTDPTGYGKQSLGNTGKPCVLNDNDQFCILYSGAFIDESHYGRGTPGHITQTNFWRDLNNQVGKGPQEISIPQSSIGYYYTGIYTVNIPQTEEAELPGIAVGIWLNYQQRFEQWQYEFFAVYVKCGDGYKRVISFGAHSAFETADIPSTYLGLAAAIYDINYETIVNELGGGYSSSSAPPGHSQYNWIREEEFARCITSGCTESGSRNSSIFLKAQDDSGSYYTLPYPDTIYIPPADNWNTYVLQYRFEVNTPWERMWKR